MKVKAIIFLLVFITTEIIINTNLKNNFQNSNMSYDKIKRPVLIENTQTAKFL